MPVNSEMSKIQKKYKLTSDSRFNDASLYREAKTHNPKSKNIVIKFFKY